MNDTNPRSVLIGGVSGTGKSRSLIGFKDRKDVLYLNCEGKPLPFKAKFKQIMIDDPYEVFGYYDLVKNDESGKFKYIVIDTISFLMDKFEAMHIRGAANGQAAWGEYFYFFRDLMDQHVAQSPAFTLILGHLDSSTNEETGESVIAVPVKGALRRKSIESFFTTAVNCQKVKIKDLDDNQYLNITKREEELGYKHVFQTRTTKKTIGDRIRGPEDLWEDDEIYIDNNAVVLADKLIEYYAD